MIAILDYGMGNLRSVENALAYLSVEHRLVRDGEALRQAGGIVLPGVGSFRAAMENLQALDLISAIHDAAHRGIPILGICLGMQLLAEHGEEGGACRGLGLIEGTVRQLVAPDPGLRLPQMGFNNVHFTQRLPLFDSIEDDSDFYFANSYHLDCDRRYAAAVTTHGMEFVSAVARDNVIGVQFHPEKSQSQGLRLLRNFSSTALC